MPDKIPPDRQEAGNKNQPTSRPQTIDPSEPTIRIAPRPERGSRMPSPQDGRQASSQPDDHGETELAPSKSMPWPRLSWPSRDAGASHAKAPEVHPQRGTDKPAFGDGLDIHQDAPTQLYRPGYASEADKSGASSSVTPRAMDDPVVGWVVLVEGPGKGKSLELGVGANSIGRSSTQKVALNFGDHEIHRERHAQIVFDPRSNRFFLQGSQDARNLTYLSDALVLVPTELKGGETIVIGQTHLRFVPFCGPHFSWS